MPMSIERQYQNEIDDLKERAEHLLSLLRHALYRNHKPSTGCTPCTQIQEEMNDADV